MKMNLIREKYSKVFEGQDLEALIENLLESLIPEVTLYLEEDALMSLKSACELVIVEAPWSVFDYVLFISFLEKEYEEPAPRFYSFLEDLQEFMEVQAPEMLLKIYEKAHPTGWKADKVSQLNMNKRARMA